MNRTCLKLPSAWLEEPLYPQQDHGALARVRAAIDIPIAAGENEFILVAFERILASSPWIFYSPVW